MFLSLVFEENAKIDALSPCLNNLQVSLPSPRLAAGQAVQKSQDYKICKQKHTVVYIFSTYKYRFLTVSYQCIQEYHLTLKLWLRLFYEILKLPAAAP